MAVRFLTLSLLVVSSLAQRSPYARRPIGYPVLEPSSTTTTDSSVLGERFGDGIVASTTTTSTTTTQRLPIEALGDRELFESLSKLPVDKQPFWLLNWRALEEHRKQAQTFHQKPNNFIDSSSFINAQRTQDIGIF